MRCDERAQFLCGSLGCGVGGIVLEWHVSQERGPIELHRFDRVFDGIERGGRRHKRSAVTLRIFAHLLQCKRTTGTVELGGTAEHYVSILKIADGSASQNATRL
jgi:hypothetical protein